MTKKKTEILQCGARVKTVIGEIEAMIVAVSLTGKNNSSVEYRISYFVNGKREAEWVYEMEVTPHQENKRKPGFRQAEERSDRLLTNGEDKD